MSHSNADAGWNFDNTYLQLPQRFYSRVQPTAVPSAQTILFNRELAEGLGLNADVLSGTSGAEIFSGNRIALGSEPIAQAYAGHQFGRFNILGDGRACLLGEQVTPSGERFDIQLKGSGPTPYSRRGDGRAALGPMLREYIISEAMQGLKIATTRSLAVVTTGEIVYRERPRPGGILVRVARSHIRVGTFEYAASLNDVESLRALAQYTLRRHYPEQLESSEPYFELLLATIAKQASLVAQWMLHGFIHGVMNTDNVALSGETIDYGPCAFMDNYSPATVFSSIDSNGRYAYINQPQIAEWNMIRLAESLLPLLNPTPERAIDLAKTAIATFAPTFEQQWLQGMRAKLGLPDDPAENPADRDLIRSLFNWMEARQADYSATFRRLCLPIEPDDILLTDAEFAAWHSRWQLRKPSLSVMCAHNPAVIPRNFRVEEAIDAAVERDDYSVLRRLLTALKMPYETSSLSAEYAKPPPAGAPPYQTFCGT